MNTARFMYIVVSLFSKACGPFMVTFFINTKLYLKVCSLGVHLRMDTKKTCLKEIGLMLSF